MACININVTGTPEIALTTVDLRWATCPMVPAHSKRDVSLEHTHKHTSFTGEAFFPLKLAAPYKLHEG